VTALPDLPCACMSARRLSRLLTRLYAEEMAGHMEPAQFGLLQMMEHMQHCTQAGLAQALCMDKTTVSRDIAVMKKRGWVEGGRGGLRVTPIGRRLLADAMPHWQQAQKRLRKALGDERWQALFAAMRVAS